MQLRLHGLSVTDLLQPEDSKYRELATSYLGDTVDLVAIRFTEKSTGQLEYVAKEREVDISLNALHVNFTRNTIAEVGHFLLDAPTSVHAPEREEEKKEETIVTVPMQVKIAVGPLRVTLNREGIAICTVELAHTQFDMNASGKAVELKCVLGDLTMTDLTVAADDACRTVISFKDSNMVDFRMMKVCALVGYDSDYGSMTNQRVIVQAKCICAHPLSVS